MKSPLRLSLGSILVFVLPLFVGGVAFAQEPWQDLRPQPWQRRSEPILSARTTKQDWCKVVCYSPHVIHHDSLFRMWYLGTSTASRTNDICMGYAESVNGIDWTEHPNNPILADADIPWGEFVQTPYILWDEEESVFKLWFISGGVDRDANRKITRNEQRLGYATSQDGIAWKVRPEPIYPSGRSPSVTKQGPNSYRMWMGSRPDVEDQASGELYTNIYEFNSTDGIRWKRGEQPVIRPSGVGTTTVYPCVIQDAGKYHMWYGCHVPGKFELFYASSNDGSQWAVDHSTSAFPARTGEAFFDNRYTSTPCIVKTPDRYLLYYSARDMKTKYIDSEGRTRTDNVGVYAHIGVAELSRRR
ncbi:MAG: hypothetical protein H8E66_12930 [Planctomycetes bacterium]|nr:hypothetical protein [Planctomycetota bacterium]